ncbi:hypothetical protein Tco_1179026 [Tanacetum coccineum]
MQDFIPMNSKLENKRLMRPRIQLDKKGVKKLKTAEVSGTEEKDSDKIMNLQQWAVLVRNEASVDVTPVKSPICDWKIFKDREFDREDVVTLLKLVKE